MAELSHTSYYQECQSKVKNEIQKPMELEFWTKTTGDRKKLIEFISRAKSLANDYKNLDIDYKDNNDLKVERESIIVDELQTIFKNIIVISKKHGKTFIELRLMFMNIEDILMSCGINPKNIKEAKTLSE